MTDGVPLGGEPGPFAGFEVTVVTDRTVYAPGDTVRISVSAANTGDRFVEHEYRGWQRFETTVRDEYHHVVAHDRVARPAPEPVRDRWLPGQTAIYPLYWAQQEGPIVPSWTTELPGPRVEPGRYRVRVTWQGSEPGRPGELADAWSRWFEIR
ncbi:MAG: hypothetical protein R3343_01820 [Nitriliruptorales bacterium]|nr:hypothetical protein [Nitriliruptorales bacterium]